MKSGSAVCKAGKLKFRKYSGESAIAKRMENLQTGFRCCRAAVERDKRGNNERNRKIAGKI